MICNHPIGSIYHLYTTYILPIGWLYATYHLLREPGNSIDYEPRVITVQLRILGSHQVVVLGVNWWCWRRCNCSSGLAWHSITGNVTDGPGARFLEMMITQPLVGGFNVIFSKYEPKISQNRTSSPKEMVKIKKNYETTGRVVLFLCNWLYSTPQSHKSLKLCSFRGQPSTTNKLSHL